MVIKIIRNALSCLFNSRSRGKSDAIMLMRKDSISQESLMQNNDEKEVKKEEKKESKGNKEEKKDEITEETIFKEEVVEDKENEIENELIKILNEKYGDSLLKEINFEQIIINLMDVVNQIIVKPEADIEERQIVVTSVNLWSMIIISQENIDNFLQFLYKLNIREDIDLDKFILRGILYCTNIFLRLCFLKNLTSLTRSLYKFGDYSFLVHVLKNFMRQYLEFGRNSKYNWKYFFNLFEYLLETSFKNDYVRNQISNYRIT